MKLFSMWKYLHLYQLVSIEKKNEWIHNTYHESLCTISCRFWEKFSQDEDVAFLPSMARTIATCTKTIWASVCNSLDLALPISYISSYVSPLPAALSGKERICSSVKRIHLVPTFFTFSFSLLIPRVSILGQILAAKMNTLHRTRSSYYWNNSGKLFFWDSSLDGLQRLLYIVTELVRIRNHVRVNCYCNGHLVDIALKVYCQCLHKKLASTSS